MLAEKVRQVAQVFGTAFDSDSAPGRRKHFEIAVAQPRQDDTLGARLGLLVPMMALAAWLWRRRQRSKYLTLLWGYWAFAVWMLGLGIYPYLPHYGGYAPLAGGVGLTLWLSVALVRYFNRRAAARRRRIVDLAIARHRCPGCDRDYLVGREIGLSLALSRRTSGAPRPLRLVRSGLGDSAANIARLLPRPTSADQHRHGR